MTGLRSYIGPTCIAIAMHGALLYLASSTWFDQEGERRVQPFRHVQAELIDLKAINKAEQDKARQAENRAEAERKARAEEEARKQREIEAKKRQAKQQEQEKRQREQALKQAEEKKQEAARAQAQKKKAEAEKAREAEARRKAEAEKTRQAEARKKAEAEKARQTAAREKAEEKRRQEELAARAAAEERARQAAIREQQQAEQAQARAAEERQVVTSAGSLIRQVIASYWSRPPSARNGMEVELRIHLLPTGEVDDAIVVRSSGDGAFDSSAVNAVLRAERFPELQNIDPVVFDRYLRRINLIFRPEDLRL